MMALSGVRSSCDIEARNADLCLLATSSSGFFAGSRRPIARSGWRSPPGRQRCAATRSPCRRTRPGRSRPTKIGPTPLPSHSIGATMAALISLRVPALPRDRRHVGVPIDIGVVHHRASAGSRDPVALVLSPAADRCDSMTLLLRPVIGGHVNAPVVATMLTDADRAGEQALAALQDLLEHGPASAIELEIAAQHLGGRALLVERFLRLAQQPHVLDRDHAPGRQTSRRASRSRWRKRPHLRAPHHEHADRLPSRTIGTPKMLRKPNTCCASFHVYDGSVCASSRCHDLARLRDEPDHGTRTRQAPDALHELQLLRLWRRTPRRARTTSPRAGRSRPCRTCTASSHSRSAFRAPAAARRWSG